MTTDALFAIQGPDPLAMTNAEVALLTASQREARVVQLVERAQEILARAIEQHITGDSRTVAATVALFSGGNDSTVLAHIFRDQVAYFCHANTGIGIEETRQFVRDTAAGWEIPLLERKAPRERDQYRHLVLTDEKGKNGAALGGFPGPAIHFKIMTRLKGRVFELVQAELVAKPMQERVVFLAGRRRDESKRRANIPESERRGSAVYVQPLVNWTKLDLNTYRLMQARAGTPVPVNQAADLVHMSGECLCGAMASPGERAEVSMWFPLPFEVIAALEAELADRDDIPWHRKTWGWGADPGLKAAEDEYQRQFKPEVEVEADLPNLCSACDDRFQAAFDIEGIA